MYRHLNRFSLALLGIATILFLVVFVATPMVCGLGPDIDRPWSSSAKAVPGSEEDLPIFVKRDRGLFMGSMSISEGRLAEELHELAEHTPDRAIVVHADRAVPFRSVANVLAAAHQAGFTRVSIITFRGTAFEAWSRTSPGS